MKKMKKIFAIVGAVLILATLFAVPSFAAGFTFEEDINEFFLSNFHVCYSPEDYTEEFDEETGTYSKIFKYANPVPCFVILEYSTPSSEDYKCKYLFTERFAELYLDLTKTGSEVYDELKDVGFLHYTAPVSLEDILLNGYELKISRDFSSAYFISSYDEQFGWVNEYSEEYANEKTSSLNEEISNLEGTITEKDAEISSLEGTIATKDTEISALEGTITEKDNEISTLENTIIQNEIDYGALEESKAASESNLNTEISALSNKNLELTATVNSLEKQMQLKINKAYASGLSDSETSFNIAPIAIGVSVIGILVTIAGLVINRKRRSKKR